MIKACWHRRGWCLSWWNPLKAPSRSAILWITKKGVPAFPFPSSVPIPFMYERNFLINTYPTPTVDGSEILQKPMGFVWKLWIFMYIYYQPNQEPTSIGDVVSTRPSPEAMMRALEMLGVTGHGGSRKSFLKNNVSHHGKAQNPGILRWFCYILFDSCI